MFLWSSLAHSHLLPYCESLTPSQISKKAAKIFIGRSWRFACRLANASFGTAGCEGEQKESIYSPGLPLLREGVPSAFRVFTTHRRSDSSPARLQAWYPNLLDLVWGLVPGTAANRLRGPDHTRCSNPLCSLLSISEELQSRLSFQNSCKSV